MAMVIGSFSLAQVPPELQGKGGPTFGFRSLIILQAITRGCGAAAKVFATIERVPDIDSLNPGGLKPAGVTGEIAFENVKFSYPSRIDVPILKGINITFPAGKTTAL